MHDQFAERPVSFDLGRPAAAPKDGFGRLTRLLIASDTVALAAAFLLAGVVVWEARGRGAVHPEGVAVFVAALPGWLLAGRLYGLYPADERSANHRTIDEWISIGQLIAMGILAVLAIAWLTRIGQPATHRLLVFAALAFVLVPAGRATTRTLARRRAAYVQNAIIVGAGEVGQLVARKLMDHPEYGINLLGFVDIPPKQWRNDLVPMPILGGVDDLAAIVNECGVDRVIVAFSKQNDQDVLARVRPLAGRVHVDVVPRMFELIGPSEGLAEVEGIPLVSISPQVRSPHALRCKRVLDIVGASMALVLTSPVFLWAAWRIPRESPGPVFYRQTRLGANMREFTMLKFRTMAVDTDQSSHHAYVERTMSGEQTGEFGRLYKLDRADVVTPTGRWLRTTSLDELPQLLNVLRGTMSLVGPRPCLAYETPYFEPHHFERFLAPAGITGLWQVTARAHASFAEALEMDVAYVRSWSLRLDLSLISRTPIEVLRQRKATM